MSVFEDLSNRTFGLLHVEGRVKGTPRTTWQVRCAGCGRRKTMASPQLKNITSTGCGSCSKVTHNQARPGRRHPYYTAWHGCVHRKGLKPYKPWTGEGGFIRFYEDLFEDVGPRPTNNHWPIRINTNLSFQPGNLEWSTKLRAKRKKRPRHRRWSSK